MGEVGGEVIEKGETNHSVGAGEVGEEEGEDVRKKGFVGEDTKGRRGRRRRRRRRRGELGLEEGGEEEVDGWFSKHLERGRGGKSYHVNEKKKTPFFPSPSSLFPPFLTSSLKTYCKTQSKTQDNGNFLNAPPKERKNCSFSFSFWRGMV